MIWEYQVRAERLAEFEEFYSATGAWAKLFQNSKGYFGTELLVDESQPHRYLTIDRWSSSQDYAAFLSAWKDQYANLDAQSESLTQHETLIGRWEPISPDNH